MLPSSPSKLYALVDMGSNGIRFSITDLAEPTARCLPTVYQDREGISLYDAQYESGTKGPIPQHTINSILAALKRFKVICSDFQVPQTNIRILATEATRSAVNGEDFADQIAEATGWEVDLLPKEAEGRIGAMGVASSFSGVEGLVMDLGGGSTQLTWMISSNGKVSTSPIGSVSLPYGAAALTQQLSHLTTEAERTSLAERMKEEVLDAYNSIQLPPDLTYKAAHGGLPLYLSGGGFRGWGYILMSNHKTNPYPIPIINGFSVSKYAFSQTTNIEVLAAQAATNTNPIFRISKRRAAQVPAVAFLVNILMSALPQIREIRFCQGGVREGFLFDALTPSIRSQNPLCAATQPHGPPSAEIIADLLHSSLPPDSPDLDRSYPSSLTSDLCRSIADLMYTHSSHPKESRATAALFTPITGLLASAHGVGHTDRALLALVLARRWGGDLAPPYDNLRARLKGILTSQEAWWAEYLGAVAGLLGHVYPAGVVGGSSGKRVNVVARWSDGLGKKGLGQGVVLKVMAREDGCEMTCKESLNGVIDEVEKCGKKKNWDVGGFGVRVRVDVEREGLAD